MKTTVILNKSLVKKYYRDKFLKRFLLLEIIILFFGSGASTYYLMKSEYKFGIALEVLTVFFVLIIYFMNRNEKNNALNLINDSEREFSFEFIDSNLKINEESKIEKKIKYSDLKVISYKHLYLFKNKNKKINDNLIYLIPKEYFKKSEWKNILKEIKSTKEDK